jgi:hypothetical protein
MREQVSPENPWAAGTFEGNEREQLQRWAKLSFEKKIEWLEEAYRLSVTLQAARLAQGGMPTVRGNGKAENLR